MHVAISKTLPFLVLASLLAGCGGSSCDLCGGPPPPHHSVPALAAQPASLQENLLGGAPQAFPIVITGAVTGLQWSASDLSFLSVSVQTNSSDSATLVVLLTGAGTSTITVRDAAGTSVSIPVSSLPCGRPDAIAAAQLISPANGAQAVSSSTQSYYVKVWAIPELSQSPFVPQLHAHFVVDNATTIDPSATLSASAPPPNAALPTPPPYSVGASGVEAGAMPQIAAGHTYKVFLSDDACEATWNAGTFST